MLKNYTKKTIVAFLFICIIVAPLCATGSKEAASGKPDSLSVLVYITGMVAGSPPYEMLADGAQEFAAKTPNVTVKVYEAGFNQATWEEQLTELVATGQYDLVLASNPSLPEICVNVANRFPNQKFIITDAQWIGHPQIRTYLYNQYEQSLYLGYLAGLVTTSSMDYANSAKKIGFIAAQEYPLLNNHMLPGFLAGAQMVDPEITMDFRVIGNWFDANKAAELTTSMMAAGVDVFCSIAGGAAQGMITTARDAGAYVVYHNTNEYAAAPGIIIGCGIEEQKKLVLEILTDVMNGSIEYGISTTVGAVEGYLDFIDTDAGYTQYVPQSIREKFDAFMKQIREGTVSYTIPPLNG